MAGLEAMILAKRENAMGGFMSYMENKYAGAENQDAENSCSDEEEMKPKKKGKAGKAIPAKKRPAPFKPQEVNKNVKKRKLE